MSAKPLRRLLDLPGVADLETKALMKPSYADVDARDHFPEIDACSKAAFGLTYDEAEAIERPAGWDNIENKPERVQVEAFEAEGWDVTDAKRRPLRMLSHLAPQLWLAVRGVAGTLPFVADDAGEDEMASSLAREAARFPPRPMSGTAHLWIAGAEAPGGYGGWGYALVQGEEAAGVAGGARRTTGAAMALTALLHALEAMTPAQRQAPLQIHAPQLTGLKGADEALEPAELWAAAAKALDKQAGGWSLAPGHQAGGDFAEAWANFALDIARGKGTFSSPIPKPNLKTLIGKLNAGRLN